MAQSWYVLRSKPRREEALWQQVVQRGVEVFYPRIPVRPVNSRARTVVPYFPGYLFVRFSLDDVGLSTFQWMPYSAGLVCFDSIPAAAPHELIDSIRRRVEAIAGAGGEPCADLQRGEAVMIHSGPFAGYEALFDGRLPGTDRVRVLLDMLSERRVLIELSAGTVARKHLPYAGSSDS